jgi:hypothetical protein
MLGVGAPNTPRFAAFQPEFCEINSSFVFILFPLPSSDGQAGRDVGCDGVQF